MEGKIYKFKNDDVYGRLEGGKMLIVANFHKAKNMYAWPVGISISPAMEYWELYNK